MSKNLFYRLLSLGMSLNAYDEDFLNDFTDEKVNDCLLMLYFYLMSNDKCQSDNFYIDFEGKYNGLNDEQKEIQFLEDNRGLIEQGKSAISEIAEKVLEIKYGKNYRY